MTWMISGYPYEETNHREVLPIWKSQTTLWKIQTGQTKHGKAKALGFFMCCFLGWAKNDTLWETVPQLWKITIF